MTARGALALPARALAAAGLLFAFAAAPLAVAQNRPAPLPTPADAKPMRPSSTLGPATGAAPPAAPATLPPGAAPGTTSPGAAGTIRPAAGAAGGAGLAVAMPNRFRSIAKPETVLFDAPSERAKKIFVAPAGMPVEVISVLRDWVKVRDSAGDVAWLNREALTDRRTVVSLAVTAVRKEPRPGADAFFDVDRGVVLELLEDRPTGGFAKVRYASGEQGYVQADQVWGL